MASSDVYRSFFEADGDACLLMQGGSILDCNQKCLDQFGCTRDDIIGKSPHQFSPERQPDGSDSAVLANQRITQAFDGGKLEFSWLHCRLDGVEFPAYVSLSPLVCKNEQVVLARIRELPDHSLPNNLASLPSPGRELSRKIDSLGLMAGGLAHDFNNFLLAILGNADLLARDLSAGRPGTELLNEIRKAAGRAADLCSQLLAFAGKGHSHFQPIDLSLTAQEMVQMIKVAITRKVALRLELTPDLPMVDGDVSQIHQVIMNLVVNASEAIGNRAGEITLATGWSQCSDQDWEDCLLKENSPTETMVYLEVRDDGEGMTEDTRLRIFDPFFSTKIRGRGLGLASVLGTIRGHQGRLCVRSVPGEGTTIRACFPVAKLDKIEAPAPRGGEVATSGHGTILLVDDEEYVLLICSRMLQRIGYNVLEASDGHQALEIYRKQNASIHGVILDLVMPIMDGVEVLERLLDINPKARVIMTSGYHENEIATRFSGRGISGFIQKPYVMSDLAKVLAKVLTPREILDPED